MTHAESSTFALHTGASHATQISNLHLGATIVVICAACFTPIELFLLELWPDHGSIGLLLVSSSAAAWAIARLLPDRYYMIRRFEASGRIYERLGIRFFKHFTPNGDYVNRIIRRRDPGYRVVHDERSIMSVEAGTRLAERSHVASLLFVVPFVSYTLMLGWDRFALWLLLPNVPFHLYPVLLQRYTRARIERVVRARDASR